MADDVVVVGRIEGRDRRPVYIWADLEIDGHTTPLRWGDGVVLATDRGWMTVKLDRDAVEPQEVRGRWGDVARSPLGQLFADKAPGDHVHVRIVGTMLAPGDVVAASGVALERALVAGAGYRDDPTSVVTVMHATCAGAGPDAASARAALDRFLPTVEARAAKVHAPPPPPKPRVKVPGVWPATALGVCAVGAAGAAFTTASVDSDWLRVALLLAGCALFAWSTRYDTPHAFELGVDLHSSIRRGWFYWLLVPAAVMGLLHNSSHDATLHGRLGGVVMAGAAPLIAIAVYAVSNRRAIRWLRIVERAPPATSPPADGTWCRLEGKIRGARDRAVVAISVKRGTGNSGGSKPSYYTVLRFDSSVDATFDVEVGGAVVRVKTEHAIIAGLPHWTPGPRRELWYAPSDPTAALVLSGGDVVTIVGRPHQGWLAASGPESLFIVRGSPAHTRRAIETPMFVYAAFVAVVGLLYAIA